MAEHLPVWLSEVTTFTSYYLVKIGAGFSQSDNSPLLFVFKRTLYELCICILHHDFNQSESVFQMKSSILKIIK